MNDDCVESIPIVLKWRAHVGLQVELRLERDRFVDFAEQSQSESFEMNDQIIAWVIHSDSLDGSS